MIAGIGTDLVEIGRLRRLLDRHGERAVARLLAPQEMADYQNARDPGRFLAKRFAAKEAFAKALGTGVRDPVLLPAIAVTHDALGRPGLAFSPAVAEILAARGLTAHLSLSDEVSHALAFVVLESR